MQGKIFNIQRFSLFDGPGIRTVVFLKGCPLDCIWCHNPEGKSSLSGIMYDCTKCIGCGECVNSCVLSLHSMPDGMHYFNRNGCTGCGKCTENCCTEALKPAGIIKYAAEIIEEVKKDSNYYCESGGGLTVSGGEPLLQADFTAELLRLARENGINTCVETSGYGTEESMITVAAYTDLFLFDWKVTNKELHKKYCGVDNSKILENLALLNKLGKEIILSCPIIPGCNDTEEHIKGIAEISSMFECVKSVKLEPYHRLGVNKAVQYGLESYFDTDIPEESAMSEYRSVIEKLSHKPCVIS